MPEDIIVFVGTKKPAINYVLACMTLLGTNDHLVIKARGRAISRAVDVAEILRRKFMTSVSVKEIQVGTEELTDQKTNRTSRVSTIEIQITK